MTVLDDDRPAAYCLPGYGHRIVLTSAEAFSAAFDGGYAWLAVLAAVNTVASLFYYLRWIVPALSRGSGHEQYDSDGTARFIAYTAAAVSLGLGVAGGPVLAALGGPLAP